MGRFTRFENEQRTVLDVWGSKMPKGTDYATFVVVTSPGYLGYRGPTWRVVAPLQAVN